MERLNGYVGALQGALQEAPEVLAAVGVNLPINVSVGVIDDVVGVGVVQTVVRQEFIGVDARASTDVAPDFGLQSGLAIVFNDGQANSAVSVLAVPFQQAHDSDLTLATGALDDARALALVHVARFAADVGFVNLNVAADFLKALVVHGEAQAVQHEPCGLLGDTKVARDFVAADAVLAVDEHPQGREPLIQTNWAVFEDAADLHRKLFLAASALPERASAQAIAGVGTSATTGALDAIRPPERGNKRDAGFNVGEVGDGAQQGVWSAVFGDHAEIVSASGW